MSRRAEIGQEKRARTRTRILAVTFDLYGREGGLFTRVEEICAAADVTRQTFYNHFASLDDLRAALTHEVSHDFLAAVTAAIATLPDAAGRTAAAIRHYLAKATHDPRWGWSMVNISASGIVFGMETYTQAERTVAEGIADGTFVIADPRVGRDIVLGGTLSAIVTLLREAPAAGFAETVAERILIALGVPGPIASTIAQKPLPSI